MANVKYKKKDVFPVDVCGTGLKLRERNIFSIKVLGRPCVSYRILKFCKPFYNVGTTLSLQAVL